MNTYIELYFCLPFLFTLFVEYNKVSVIGAVDRMCKEDHYKYCRVKKGTFPYAVPSNVDEFENVCNLINTYYPCFKEYERRCYNVFEPNFDIYFGICYKDSFAFEEAKNNLKCFEKVDEYNNADTCRKENDKIWKSLVLSENKELALMHETLSYSDLMDVITVLRMYTDLDCFLKLLEECPKTYEIVLEIFKLYHSSLTDKWEADAEKLLDFIDYMESDQKLSIKETISKYGKTIAYGRSDFL